MRHLSGSPVPSTSVLKYLKAQSENLYQSANINPCISRQHSSSKSYTSRPSYRPLCTTTKRRATHQNPTRSAKLLQHEISRCSLPPQSNHNISCARHISTRTSKPVQNTRWASLWSKIRGKPNFNPWADQSGQGAGQEDTSAQLFNLSRALARSPTASDLKLRCTEFDANGSVTVVSGEFKKSELIAKYGLQPRDLRKIDSSVLPHILVRPSAILINLLHLRVLIQSDRVLVFDAYGSTDSYTQSLFMYDLEGKLRQKPDPRATSTYLPYEFRALEAVLISVTSGLEAEFALVRDPVTNILRALEEDIDREKLRHLLIHSKKLGTFEQKARLVRDAIDDLLEADDDLAAMYLTERKSTGTPREEDDHQDIEMLLESYHKICDEIVEISGNLISNIRNTEEVVKAILDANRNQLMLLEIKFSVGTLGLAGGTLIAGLYGMNLNNFIEETNFGFTAVTVTSFVISGIICVYGMRKLRKVQKVRMIGESLNPTTHLGNTKKAWREFAAQRHGTGNEAMDIQARNQRLAALKQRDWSQQQSRMPWGGGAQAPNTGPVLWPGMEGLGMHKLNNSIGSTETPGSNAGGQVDEETGHGYSADKCTTNDPAQYNFRIHDDLENTEQRMNEDMKKQKGIATRNSGTASSPTKK